MKRIRLTDLNDPNFARAWRLYKGTFPIDERRRLSSQRHILLRSIYHFDIIVERDTFIGILLWWEFENVRYVEHFAVIPALRGMRHGGRILRRFLAESDLPVWLEVEFPEDGLKRRRINFYRRAGFILNDHPYLQPAYERSTAPVSLLVMTYPEAISEPDIRYFCREYQPMLTDYRIRKG